MVKNLVLDVIRTKRDEDAATARAPVMTLAFRLTSSYAYSVMMKKETSTIYLVGIEDEGV